MMSKERNFVRFRIALISLVFSLFFMVIAAKAVYLAGIIDTEDGASIVEAAAKSRKQAVRLAAIAAAETLPPKNAELVLDRVLKSKVPNVRASAVKCLAARGSCSTKMVGRIRSLSKSDPNKEVRSLLRNTLKEVKTEEEK